MAGKLWDLFNAVIVVDVLSATYAKVQS